MAAMQVATASLFGARLENGAMGHRDGVGLILCMCTFVACFTASWGRWAGRCARALSPPVKHLPDA